MEAAALLDVSRALGLAPDHKLLAAERAAQRAGLVTSGLLILLCPSEGLQSHIFFRHRSAAAASLMFRIHIKWVGFRKRGVASTQHGKHKDIVFTLGHCILYDTLYSVYYTLYSDKLCSRRDLDTLYNTHIQSAPPLYLPCRMATQKSEWPQAMVRPSRTCNARGKQRWTGGHAISPLLGRPLGVVALEHQRPLDQVHRSSSDRTPAGVAQFLSGE